MPINEKFLTARAAEARQRLLTHVGVEEAIEIPYRWPRRGHRAFRVPQRLLTERMRLELQLSRNAFVCPPAGPLLGDVYGALWRMHPEFCRPRPERAHLLRYFRRARGKLFLLWYAYGRLRTARLQRWLSAQVAACDLFAATAALRARFAAAEQDAPGASLEDRRRPLVAPPFCYFDDLVDYFSSHYHLSPEQVLDLPRALVHQLYRNRQLSEPDGELSVFAPSDALL